MPIRKETTRTSGNLRYSSTSSNLRCAIVCFLGLLLLSFDDCYIRVIHGKKDRNLPHGHRGKLNPYIPGPFSGLQLTKDDEQTLTSGHSVMKQTVPTDGSSAGAAICVQDVNAPLHAVWYQILDMDHYPKKVSKVLVCQNYVVQTQPDGNIRIKTKQVLGVLPGYSYESYYDHTFYPEKSSMTWSLDYDKTSDIDDVAGHWHVTSHPIKGNSCSRVYYACDIQMKGHVPKPIFNYISKAALRQATSWVKRESEAHPDLVVSKIYGGDRLPFIRSAATHEDDKTLVSSNKANTKQRKGWFNLKQ